MDFSVLGAGIVEERPFGVLLITGMLGGGGLSRGSWIWGDGWLVSLVGSGSFHSRCVHVGDVL